MSQIPINHCSKKNIRASATSSCAKVCNFDSHAAAMRIVPPIKMHDNIEKEHLGHRERLFDTLSLDLALLSKIILHFDSSFSDKLWHKERHHLPMC